MTHDVAGTLNLSAEELAGDLPMVCAHTGHPAQSLTPVWFARSPTWAWLPLGALALWAVITTDWAPLASWWTFGALLVPLMFSRGVTGRIPLDQTTRRRIAGIRRRRFRLTMTALLLTWVAVLLRLTGSYAASILVFGAVVAMYLMVVTMVVYGRTLAVRGWPQEDGGVTLRDAHPAFVAAVELRRTGHRP
ncbi:MAG: hypothetical protein ACR2HR_13045 [Euzebya sp.]